MNLEKVFEDIIDLPIDSIDYDIMKGSVKIIIKDTDIKMLHKIIFKHVSFCIFLQNTNNQFEDDSYREISYISFDREIIDTKKIKQKWLKSYSFDFNVVMEIIYSTLLLKAELVEFDGIVYDLKNKK